ncbi:MAG TPA: benzoate-CoA ligase family protein [Candidatus Eremiobacteraceae bacterium]|nr:benzoate-CoA ligase family protein [Candidatus Eremiobacteraceae bacterium]
MTGRSAHVDRFAADNLPPMDQWPDFIFELPELRYPAQLNCAQSLIDGHIAAGRGERAAIVDAAGTRTYAQLSDDANRIAGVLRNDLGLAPGARVLIRGFNNAVFAASWLGVVKAGCIAVSTMPLLRSKELTEVIEKAQVGAAICDRRLAEEFDRAARACPTMQRVVYSHDDGTDGLAARMRRQTGAPLTIDTAADDVCMIAFTSGTTGKPKGTMHFHRDVLAICDTFSAKLTKPSADDVFMGSPPLAFTFGLGGVLLFPLHAGASVVMLEKPTPDAMLEAVARHRVTTCYTAPTAYRAMTPLVAGHDVSSLHTCVSAGEMLPIATRAAWREKTGIDIIDGIGSTEMLHIFIAAAGDDIRPGATGKPVPGYKACVLDDDGKPAPNGTVGRLAVKGPTGCRYLSDDRQRQYVSGGWNLTGDSYIEDADGYFYYQARSDDMIISAGYNIAGPEVESALLTHADVLECAVVGMPDEDRGMIVKAFVVLRDGVAGDDALAKRLQDHVKAEIAPYKYPRSIAFLPALPRTETGKLQRFKLRQGT